VPQRFDAHVGRYDEDLQRGLSVSGESRDYFARGRIDHLARCLGALGFGVDSLLDFGCGDGASVPLLRSALGARRAIGTDVSQPSLDLARSRHPGPGVDFVADSALPACDALDLVYSNGTFHHIAPPERIGVLRRIHAWLRPGGCFALFENNPWNPGTRLVMSRIPFDRDAVVISAREARRVVRAAGFDVLRCDFLFVFPRALRALRSLEARLAALPLGAQYMLLTRR